MFRTTNFDLFFKNLDSYDFDNVSHVVRSETDKSIVFELAVPGVAREEILVEVVDGVLSVRVDSKTKLTRSFEREWSLGDSIDAAKMQAKLENGVLSLILPKVKREDKKISITVT